MEIERRVRHSKEHSMAIEKKTHSESIQCINRVICANAETKRMTFSCFLLSLKLNAQIDLKKPQDSELKFCKHISQQYSKIVLYHNNTSTLCCTENNNQMLFLLLFVYIFFRTFFLVPLDEANAEATPANLCC